MRYNPVQHDAIIVMNSLHDRKYKAGCRHSKQILHERILFFFCFWTHSDSPFIVALSRNNSATEYNAASPASFTRSPLFWQ